MQLRTIALGFATFLGGAAALTAAALAYGRREEAAPSGDEPRPLDLPADAGPAPNYAQVRDPEPVTGDGHAAPDLAADAEPGQRAPAAFRPDMDAPMTAAEREALRPTTGPQPTLIDAGTSLPLT